MTDHDKEPCEDDDSGALRALLKQSLTTPDASPKGADQVLPEVQRKLRERSGGKFYRTAWSQAPPSKVAVAMAVVLLVAAAILMWALSPRL
jgi:hypothetical protein